jgi:quinol monooxygenase YgiN
MHPGRRCASTRLWRNPHRATSTHIDVVSAQIRQLPGAPKGNGAASANERACRAFNTAVSQKDVSHVFVFEVYDNVAAFNAHLQTAFQ